MAIADARVGRANACVTLPPCVQPVGHSDQLVRSDKRGQSRVLDRESVGSRPIPDGPGVVQIRLNQSRAADGIECVDPVRHAQNLIEPTILDERRAETAARPHRRPLHVAARVVRVGARPSAGCDACDVLGFRTHQRVAALRVAGGQVPISIKDRPPTFEWHVVAVGARHRVGRNHVLIVIVVVERERLPDAAKVREACRRFRGLASRAQRWEEDRDQHRDDGDDHQQLD